MGPTAGRVSVTPFSSLSGVQLRRWRELADADPALDSPYFDPGFTAAVARVDPSVRVAVETAADGTPAAFLPLQLRRRTATAAGHPGTDVQGPVCAPGHVLDVAGVLRAAGVTRLHLDHLRAGAGGFDAWSPVEHAAPVMDVSGGLDGYLGRVSAAGRANIGQARRRRVQLERDHGPVRFVPDERNPDTLTRLIELKRRQYRATGAADYFAPVASRKLIAALHGERGAGFGGRLSALYAGDGLVAAHFGLYRGPVLHWWFPVYDPAYARYAPGWVLLRELVSDAPRAGVTRIDLGRGEDEYKRRAMTGRTWVREVVVETDPLRRVTGRVQRAAVRRARESPRVRSAVRAVRRLRRQALP